MKCQAGLQIVFFAKPLQKRRNRLGPCQQVRVNSVKYTVLTHIPLGLSSTTSPRHGFRKLNPARISVLCDAFLCQL